MSNVTRWPVDIPRSQSEPVVLEEWELPHSLKQRADERMQHQHYMRRQHGTECCADTNDDPAPTWLNRLIDRLDARHGLGLLALSAALVAGCALFVWGLVP